MNFILNAKNSKPVFNERENLLVFLGVPYWPRYSLYFFLPFTKAKKGCRYYRSRKKKAS